MLEPVPLWPVRLHTLHKRLHSVFTHEVPSFWVSLLTQKLHKTFLAVAILFYPVHKIALREDNVSVMLPHVFSGSCQSYGALVPFTSNKFARSPCFCYRFSCGLERHTTKYTHRDSLSLFVDRRDTSLWTSFLKKKTGQKFALTFLLLWLTMFIDNSGGKFIVAGTNHHLRNRKLLTFKLNC
jgi:hypothetical protein